LIFVDNSDQLLMVHDMPQPPGNRADQQRATAAAMNEYHEDAEYLVEIYKDHFKLMMATPHAPGKID